MKNRLIILGLIAATQLSLSSCSENESAAMGEFPALQSEVLTDLSVDVITETYANLQNNSRDLYAKAENLAVGDEHALQTAKESWKNTRAAWQKSEGFLFGPVVNKGIDPAIDAWPIDLNAINSILESDQEITSALLESNNETRGFHTIEYFLWGKDGNKTASELTQREIEYILAATKNLKEHARSLYIAWCHDGRYFASNFIHAGENTSIYSTQKNALKAIAKGMASIADEVANKKIEIPLNGANGTANPEAVESRFSHNAKLDFANNIRSIQNVYLGDFEAINGSGLSVVVAKTNASLDRNIKTAITEAITAIETIPGTFSQAIVNNRTAVKNAQNKVAELQILLQAELLPLISEL